MALIVLMTLGCISATMQGQINQIEIWFSILVRKLLRRSSFISKTQIKARILEFINISTARWRSLSSGLIRASP